MSMSFYGRVGDDDDITCPEHLEVTMTNGNAAWVLRTLGFEVMDGYFEADIDEFIGTTLITSTTGPILAQDYLNDKIQRLYAQAVELKARGAVKIYGA